jgi:protein involved in polysaccharide export with SLBB domain
MRARILALTIFVLLSFALMVPVGAQQQGTDALERFFRDLERGVPREQLLRGLRTDPSDALSRSRLGAQRQPGGGFGLNEPTLPMFKRSAPTEIERIAFARFCEQPNEPANVRRVALISAVSQLERDYCARARSEVYQFGYDIFDGGFSADQLVNGAVHDGYRLGIGDELIITFQGRENRSTTTKVDREGRLVLSDLPPIRAAGRSFADFRAELERRTAQSYVGTNVFVSLGAVRQFGVVVVGAVERPGLHQLTGLSSVIVALGLAGGIEKFGSLRRVQLVRENRATWVDLYDLFLTGGGASEDYSLMEGDRIVVPTIGDTVAVTGNVKRPAIYELREGAGDIAAVDALALAGGPLRPQGIRFELVTFDTSGKQVVREARERNFSLRSGDILHVRYSEDVQVGGVDLLGHVRVPGRRSLGSAPTIRALIGDESAFLDDPYLLFAILETTDETTRARRSYGVNLEAILSNAEDVRLIDGDRLTILSADDIRYLSAPRVQSVLASGGRRAAAEVRAPDEASTQARAVAQARAQIGAVISERRADLSDRPTDGTRSEGQAAPDSSVGADERPATERGGVCRSLVQLGNLMLNARDRRFATATLGLRPEDFVGGECRPVYEANTALLPFVLEHVLVVTGDVRAPGVYPVATPSGLGALAAVAGGLGRQADPGLVEISRATEAPDGSVRTTLDTRRTSIDTVRVSVGDAVHFASRPLLREVGSITLAGEFVRPGTYTIRPGERLSEVFGRAGGLTPQAYPYGVVFTRESARRAEEANFRRLSRELSSALANSLTGGIGRSIDSGTAGFLSTLSRDLSQVEAVGRVVIEADPTVLQIRPELDVILEPGDRVVMPKRPASVQVSGQVLSPGAQQFLSGSRVESYIARAGGYSTGADRRRVFVLLPNGAAQPVAANAFSATTVQIPPGSTIIVPRDVSINLLAIVRDVSSIIGQLAIAAASLAVISDR